MNAASNPVSSITDRISSIEARFGARPPMSGAAATALAAASRKQAGATGSDSSFGQLVDRLVSSSTTSGPRDASTALADVLEQLLQAHEPSPVATRGAVTTVEEPLDGTDPALRSGAGQRIVDLASEHIGVPYVWGGEDPSGFDCSGLVQFVYAKLGIDLPRVSRDQAQVGQPVASLSDAVPGDLVAFGTPVDHIGIYTGNGQMVVAPRTGDVVKLQQIRREPVTIRRILATEAGATPSFSATGAGDGASGSNMGYLALFSAAEARHGVSAELLEAVAKQESGFDANAVSPAGAQGLMQLMPGTAQALGVNPFDPAEAVDGSARLLSQHLRRFGSVPLALAAYNAGPGAVEKFGGIPPYRETQGYVRKIMADLADNALGDASLTSASGIERLSDQPAQVRRSAPLFSDGAVRNNGTSRSTGLLPTTNRPSSPASAIAALASLPGPGTRATSSFLVAPASPAAALTSIAAAAAAASTSTATATATSTAAAPAISAPGPVSTVPSPSMVPATASGVPGFTLPEGKLVSPAKGAWGPNTQMQITSVGGSNTMSWLESGLLEQASPADVAAIVASAPGPVAKGVLKILQNATAAQLISPEFRQTLNDVNRDALGLPDAPDVIPVQPPAPSVAPTTASGAPSVAPPAPSTPTPAATAATSPIARTLLPLTPAK